MKTVETDDAECVKQLSKQDTQRHVSQKAEPFNAQAQVQSSH